MYLVYQYISNEDKKLHEAYGITYNIVIAKRDILQFETIRPTDVELLTIPNAVVRDTYQTNS